jgi:hypothetical protein
MPLKCSNYQIIVVYDEVYYEVQYLDYSMSHLEYDILYSVLEVIQKNRNFNICVFFTVKIKFGTTKTTSTQYQYYAWMMFILLIHRSKFEV